MLKNKAIKIFLLLLLIIIIVFPLFIFKVQTLQINNFSFKKTKTIWQKKVKDGDSFSIKYIHSVAKTPVIEFFEINDGKILLTGTEYQSYGAGLPTSTEGNYILKNDKFIIKNIDQFLPKILLRVSDYAEHEFIYKNHSLKLYEEVKTETLLQFRTEKICYFRFYYKEVLKWLKKNI